jgi:hypothetical protein
VLSGAALSAVKLLLREVFLVNFVRRLAVHVNAPAFRLVVLVDVRCQTLTEIRYARRDTEFCIALSLESRDNASNQAKFHLTSLESGFFVRSGRF